MAFVFLILVFLIDQQGISDKHCLLSFFSLKDNFRQFSIKTYVVGTH